MVLCTEASRICKEDIPLSYFTARKLRKDVSVQGEE